MAKMFPDQLRSDIKSNAEKLLYQAFKEQLSDNFTVFHQVRWQARNLRSGARDGEADFVIACPNLGILVLEVKGGSISYDGRNKQWYSNGNSIKDPFQQACDSQHNLLKRLKELNYWRNRWIPMGYAVAFPDIKVNGRLLHAPSNIILDNTHLNNLSAWVQSVLNYWRGQEPPQGELDIQGIRELVRILSPSITPQSVQVRTAALDQEFKHLTEQQIGILDFLASHRRVAISGCAGSGKTLLALDKARRLHEQGFSVLVTCYNSALAQFLRNSLGRKQNLHVYTFHALCRRLFCEAGFTEPDQNLPQGVIQEIYASRLTAAADKLNWRVDAVIVDEGQDFCEDWWLALKLLLNDPDNGICYFFHDNNQNIFGRGWQPPLEEAPFTLTKNCRNTRRIHNYVIQFHNQPNSTIALGPEGRNVETYSYSGDTQLKNSLGSLLHRLVVNEGFQTKDITILTTRRRQSLQNEVVGQFRVKAEPSQNEIRCTTIGCFKGLESKVVILVKTDLTQTNNLLYVGASRASHHLIVLQPSQPGLAS